MKGALLFVSLASLFFLAQAGIFEYQDVLPSSSRILERVAMWSLQDTPAGSTTPYADFDLALTKQSHVGYVEVLFFAIKEMENVGFGGPTYGRYLCCAPGMDSPSRPCPLGQVALNPRYYNHSSPTFHYTKLSFQDSYTLSYKEHFTIEETDLYYFIIVNCRGGRNADAIGVSGKTAWMNPYGYLNGEDFGFLPFYIAMIVVYLVTVIVWIILLWNFRQGLLMLQHCITVMILLGLLEQIMVLIDYLQYNSDGTISMGLAIAAVSVKTIKQTFSRILLIAVCMGLGVVKKRLHWGLLVLLVIYAFLFYGFSEVSEASDTLQDKTTLVVSPAITLYTVFPVFFLDLIFFCWVFLSLYFTIQLLKDSGSAAKLTMYRKLRLVLFSSALFSAVMVILELVVLGLFADGLWKIWWVWDSYWVLLGYLILLATATIWRPNPNNGRFAYEELSTSDTGEDTEMADMNQLDTSVGIEEDVIVGQEHSDNKPKESAHDW